MAIKVQGTTIIDDSRNILDASNVGVGTALPSSKLHVVGDVLITGVSTLGVSTFTGNVSFGTSAYFGDNDSLNLGDSNDLQIFHDGSNSYIADYGTGRLVFASNGAGVDIIKAPLEYTARFVTDGAVELYYDNSKEFETTGYGATVFGTLETQGLNVVGFSTFAGITTVTGSTLFAKQLNISGVSTISVNSSGDALRITQIGAGNAIVVEDETNPDATPFVVRNDGNVGLGTTNPLAILHLQSTVPIIRFVETDAAANNRNWNVGVNAQEFYWQALNDAGSGGGNLFKMVRSSEQIQTFEGRNSGNTWFLVDNNTQRVGIGTSIASSVLDVRGGSPWFSPNITGAKATALRLGRFTDGVNAAFDIITEDAVGDTLEIQSNRYTGQLKFSRSSPSGIQTTFILDSNYAAGTNISIADTTGTSIKIRIDEAGNTYFNNTGNFGIGIVNPTSKLHVVGDTLITGVSTLGIATFTGVVSFGTSAYFGDNDQLVFGDGSDLRIYHDGSNSFIQDLGTGGLYLAGSNIIALQSAAGESKLIARSDGAVELYYDNSKEFETTGYGATVFGVLETQGLNATGISTISINSALPALRINQLGTGYALVVEDETNPDVTPFVINASGNTGIGTTNPSQKLHVEGNQFIRGILSLPQNTVGVGFGTTTNVPPYAITQTMGDNDAWLIYGESLSTNSGSLVLEVADDIDTAEKIIFRNRRTYNGAIVGVSTYMEMKSNANIIEFNPLLIGAASSTGTSNQRLQVTGGTYISGNLGVGIINPTSKLHVVGDALITGVSTLGITTFTGVVSFGTSAYFGDNDTLNFGDGNDLVIFHNGSNSVINDQGTGGLVIGGSTTIDLMNPAATEYYARFNDNGSVALYFDNTKEFETTGYGATVFGVLEAQGLNVSGVSTLGRVQISSGIVTASTGIVTYYGDAQYLTKLTGASAAVYGNESTIPIITVDSAGRITSIGTSGVNFSTSTVAQSNSTRTISTDTNASHFLTFVNSNNPSGDFEVLYTDSGVVYNPNTNNLGIGAVTPSLTLDVVGTGAKIGTATTYTTIGNDFGRNIEIGVGSTTLDTYLDFQGSATYTDYAARLIRTAGDNGNFNIINRGTGTLRLTTQDAGAIDFSTNNTFRHRIDSNGVFLVGTSSSTGTASQLLQVNSGGYFNGSVGIGTTNPSTLLGLSATGTISWGGSGYAFIQGSDSSSPSYLRLGTSGSESIRIDNTGRVGIGTTNPLSKLDVFGGNIRLTGTTNPSFVVVPTSGSSYTFGANTAVTGGGIYDNTATAWRLVVKDTTGNILVNTISETGTASQPLQVSGGTYISGSLGVGRTNPGSFSLDVNGVARIGLGAGGKLTVGTGMAAGEFGLQILPYSDRTELQAEQQGTSYRPLILQPFGSFVGIGTTIPAYRLHVTSGGTSGTGQTIAYFTNTTNADRISIIDENTGNRPPGIRSRTAAFGLGLYADAGPIIFYNGSGDNARARFDLSGNFLINSASATGTASQPLQVTGGAYVSGNLGIGTTNPQYALDTNQSNVRIAGLTITRQNSGTPFSATEISTAFNNQLYFAATHLNAGYGVWLRGKNVGDTGFDAFDEGSGQHGVAIYANNSERVRINKTGNVGIGSSSPTEKLDVAGNIKLTGQIYGPSELIIDPAVVGNNTGLVRIKGDLYVDGTQFVVNSTTIELADLNVGIATTVGTNALLDGAGIGIGSTNIRKTITWNNTASALTSSEDWNLTLGKVYEINGTSVLSSTTLGSGVVNSSLTSLGTLTQLSVSGVSTLGRVQISSGIVTASTGIVTYYGDAQYLTKLTGASAATYGSDVTIPVITVDSTGRITSIGTSGVNFSTSTVSQSNSTRTISTDTNASHFLTFVNSNNPSGDFEVLYTDSGVVYNPNTNNLGIGTTNPLQNLHVLGNLLVAAGTSTGQHITQKAYELNNGTISWEGSAGQLFSITNNLTTGSIFSVNDVSGIPSIDVNADGTVQLGPYGGNIGVGTTNPSQKLVVSGTTLINTNTSTGTASQLLQVTGGAYIQGNLGVGNTNPGAKLDVTGDIRLSAADPEIEFNTGGPRLKVPAANTLTIHTGGGLDTTSNEQIRINTTGVGIGTTNPLYRLHVGGDIKLQEGGTLWFSDISGSNEKISNGIPGNIDIYADDNIRFYESDLSTIRFAFDVNNGRFIFENNTNTYISQPLANELSITNNSIETIRFSAISNVGIGTTNPTSKLQVQGDGRFIGIVTSTGLYPSSDNSGSVGDASRTWNSGQFTNFTVDTLLTATRLDITNIIDLLDSNTLQFGSSDDVKIFYDGVANDFEIELETTANKIAITDNGTYKHLITRDGKVGINTSATPTSELEVYGNFAINNDVIYGSFRANTATTTQTAIYSGLSTTVYRSVEYTIQATQSTNFHTTKILVIHNGTTAYHTEYGSIFNNSSVAIYDVDVSGGNLRLLATPASASSTDYKISFTAVKV